MQTETSSLPNDIEQCHAIIVELSSRIQHLTMLNEKQKLRLMQLLRRQYGQRADRLSSEQLVLWAAEEMEEGFGLIRNKGKDDKKKVRRGHGRKKPPKALPRKQVVYDLSTEEKICPCCLTEKKQIGREVTEQLEYEPASIYIIEHIQLKYACKACEQGIELAQKPVQPIEKGLPGPGLLAHVIVSKYKDHLPLYRQEGILERHGVNISRSTMCGWIKASAELLTPLYDLMCRRTIQSKYINTDDTPMPVLDKSKTKTRKGRIWVYAGDKNHPYIVFDYTPNRSRDGPIKFLKGFKGYLQADAYPGYDVMYRSGKVVEVGCWSHSRRKYHEAEGAHPVNASIAMAWIQRLYKLERSIKNFEPLRKQQIRQRLAKPILENFNKWLKDTLTLVLPKSQMGKAISYSLSNWKALTRYLEDGNVAIDNNRAERILRGPVLGRKNYLFYGSDTGGQRAAILMSLIATCCDHKIDPFLYLRDVIDRISDHPMRRLDELLPDRWLEAKNQLPAAA